MAPNGDWLVAYQDGLDDPGHDSFIRQVRSHDGGQTWVPDDIVYDERDKGVGCRNPAFGLTADGGIVLVIQRVSVCERPTHPHELLNSTYCISSDNGRSYEYKGYVDPLRPRGHGGSPCDILRRDGTLYMAAFSIDGLVLYTSEDDASSWQNRATMVQPSEVPETPYYPTIIFRPDGTLLCQFHINRAMENYQKASKDDGRTWTGLKPANIRLRHPVLAYVGGVMIAVGRIVPSQGYGLTGFYLSGNDGESWKGPFMLDLPRGGAYTAVIPLGERVFVVFSCFLPSPDSRTGQAPNAIQGFILKDISMQP